MENKVEKKTSIGKILLILSPLLLLLVVGLGFKVFNDKEPEEVVEEPKHEIWDVNKIPTMLELDELMKLGYTKFYGEDGKRGLDTTKELRTIYDTNISFVERVPSDSIDTMAMVAMAFQRNPYAIKDSHKINTDVSESLKTLPDSSTIDLGDIEQVYDKIKFYVVRENPAIIYVEGWCNGEYFKEGVNLLEWYEANNYFQ